MLVADLARWLRAAAMATLLALPAGPAPGGLALGVVASAVGIMLPSAVWARRGFSGGYFRPSLSRSAFGGRRIPSFSGGYGRPRSPGFGSSTWKRSAVGGSASDRAFSRRGAGSALGNFRSRRQGGEGGGAAPSAGGFGGAGRRGGWDSSGWYSRSGWSLPRYAYASPPRFGVWNALLLWFLLDHLGSPGHAAFFYNHQDDPGYRQWRSEADRKAQSDPDLKAKLDQLDRDLAARQGQPRDPDYLPPDVPAAVAHGGHPRAGGGMPWLLLLPLAGAAFLFWRGLTQRSGRQASGPSRGRAAWRFDSKDGTVDTLKTLGNFLHRKTSGERYTPSLFRVGMTLTVDPAPFLLAAGVTKVPAPAGAGQLTSVEAVGAVTSGTQPLTRLYLPGSGSFFQIHVDDAGQPDECRYFSVIDEVYPADAEEWGFWLDDAEGMIGWSEFQTKDGKLYQRVWAPGPQRTRPLTFLERLESVQGTRTLSTQVMLYAAATAAPAPAPQTEYVLVSAVEEGEQAWVQIAAGIDVNPASLTLS